MTRYLLIFAMAWLAVEGTVWSAEPDAKALIDAGIPALDREWSGDDYQTAAQVLKSGKVPLPKLSDPVGHALFLKFVSTENFRMEMDHSLSINQRLADYLKLMNGVSSILGQYASMVKDGQATPMHEEMARMMAFSLRVAALGIQLSEEFIPTIPHDADYDARMAGVKQFHSGITTMFVGVEESLSEKATLTEDDLSLLLDAMAETLPQGKKAFPPGFKEELMKKLEAHKADFPKEKDAANLQKMIVELGN